MALKRGRPKKWTQRKLALKEEINEAAKKRNLSIRYTRNQFAEDIKSHRMKQFSFGAYKRDRCFEYCRNERGFDIEKYIRGLIPGNRRLFVLDSGAGFFMLDAEIKRAFGDKVFVTAVNPKYPEAPETTKEKFREQIRQAKRCGEKNVAEQVEKHLQNLREAERNVKIIDEKKIGIIENFQTRRKYDVIIDFYGGLDKAGISIDTPGRPDFREHILTKYFWMLRPNGRILLMSQNPSSINGIILRKFGENSQFAKRTGYYLSQEQGSGEAITGIWEIIKKPVAR